MSIIYRLKQFYWKFIASPAKYARHLGVTIGDNCLISTRNWPSEGYLIRIGNNVQVTMGVYFHTHGGGHTIRRFNKNFDVFGKIVVEDWAYIGAGSSIMPGVTIGEGALVAAGSVVTKSVAPNTIVGGNPARFICTVQEYLERNAKYNVETYYMDPKKKRTFLLELQDEKFLKK